MYSTWFGVQWSLFKFLSSFKVNGIRMFFSKLLVSLCAVFFISSCSAYSPAKSEAESQPQEFGRIAFPVSGKNALGRSSHKASGVEMKLVHQETGEVHTLQVKYAEGKWVEYVDNLTPGLYTINEYFLYRGLSRPLEPVVEIMVEAGQTVLSPVFVSMVAHVYPQSWVGQIEDESYWDDYR